MTEMATIIPVDIPWLPDEALTVPLGLSSDALELVSAIDGGTWTLEGRRVRSFRDEGIASLTDFWLCEGDRDMLPLVCSAPLPNIFEMPILSMDNPFRCRLFDDPDPPDPVLPFCVRGFSS